MSCKHCNAAFAALIDQLVELKIDLRYVHEALMEHDDRLDQLLEEDAVFESGDEPEADFGDE